MTAAAALLVPLIFTVPATNQLRVGVGDTAYVYCAGGDSTKDVAWIRVYRLPISGGIWRLTDSLYVRGREGLEDTVWVDPGAGAHFYVAAVDTVGNQGCASENTVYYGPVTGVGTESRGPPQGLDTQYFDVQGRFVRRPTASGIYFWYAKDEKGRVVRRGKLAVVR